MTNEENHWHLIPGNGEIQIENIMQLVRGVLAGEDKYFHTKSQGFKNDEQAAKNFVITITNELKKLGLEGLHDLHQSKNGSGNWYYALRAIWPSGLLHETIFSSFREASYIARFKNGRVKREGNKWRVIF